MTAKAVAAAPARYGMYEIRAASQKYTVAGTATAVLFHLLAIVLYYSTAGLYYEPPGRPGGSRIPVVLIPHPTIGAKVYRILPAGGGVRPAATMPAGVPVPVPDAAVSPEQTIPGQNELNLPASTFDDEGAGRGDELGNGEFSVPPPVIAIDEDPPEFRYVEHQPVPVKRVTPLYPEFARQAGLEGTVWVKILIDTEGRVKKASILKRDTDAFDDVAMAAALQWVFRPALVNDGPVSVWASIPFRFTLTR